MMTRHDPSSNSRALDGAGTVAGSLCALHCGLSALAPGLWTLLGLGSLMAPIWEWTFLLVALAVALLAARVGWRRHRDRRVLGAFGLAVGLLVSARAIEMAPGLDLGPWMAIAGGVGLAAAHIWNLRRTSARSSL